MAKAKLLVMIKDKVVMSNNPGEKALWTKRRMLWAWVQILDTIKAMAKDKRDMINPGREAQTLETHMAMA
jgi:hypothetical protein